MSTPKVVYRHFDKTFDGMEYALIDMGAAVTSLRHEAKAYFGKDFKVSSEQAREILDEICKYSYPKARVSETDRSYMGVPGNDFLIHVATFVEV